MNGKIIVNGAEITVTTIDDKDYISLTDMLKAKDGDFFISDWLRNRNTVEFLGIWEQIHNPEMCIRDRHTGASGHSGRWAGSADDLQ